MPFPNGSALSTSLNTSGIEWNEMTEQNTKCWGTQRAR